MRDKILVESAFLLGVKHQLLATLEQRAQSSGEIQFMVEEIQSVDASDISTHSIINFLMRPIIFEDESMGILRNTWTSMRKGKMLTYVCRYTCSNIKTGNCTQHGISYTPLCRRNSLMFEKHADTLLLHPK